MSRVAPPKSLPATKRDTGTGAGGSGDLVKDGELLPSRLHRMSLAHIPSASSSPASSPAAANTRPSTSTTSTDPRSSSPDICPVCKSSRYLNASLRFLVNPECYHTMCESCVDRIFSHGPAQCPIAGCRRTLRKARFRAPTFEDLAVEREVDIRRRVAAVFNRRADEFETLRDYNDYLNDVEDITFNLVHGLEVEATTRRFDQYRAAHEREIAANASRAEQESRSFSQRQRSEREQAKLRRETARREEAEERRDREENRRDVLRRLEDGQDAEKVLSEHGHAVGAHDDGGAGGGGDDDDGGSGQGGGGVRLKKRMNRQAAAERAQQLQAADARNGSGDLVIKGLKRKVQPAPEAPVDPFGGLAFEPRNYYTLQDAYVWNVLQDAKSDPVIAAGGYDVRDFSHRALGEAFAGLGVFLADEMAERDKALQNGKSVGTAGGQLASADVPMDDPF